MTIENQEDPEFQNFIIFPEVDSTFHNFPEVEEGGSRPLDPPENNPTCTNPPSPRPNFSLLATIVSHLFHCGTQYTTSIS